MHSFNCFRSISDPFIDHYNFFEPPTPTPYQLIEICNSSFVSFLITITIIIMGNLWNLSSKTCFNSNLLVLRFFIKWAIPSLHYLFEGFDWLLKVFNKSECLKSFCSIKFKLQEIYRSGSRAPAIYYSRLRWSWVRIPSTNKLKIILYLLLNRKKRPGLSHLKKVLLNGSAVHT